MKLVTIGLFAAAALLAGCREHRYFVDLDRVAAEADEGKRTSDDLKRELAEKQREAGEADAAAKKAEEAKDADAAAKRARAADIGDRLQREFTAHSNAARTKLLASARVVLQRIASDRGVDSIATVQSVAFVDPAGDVTDEVVRRLNAGVSRDTTDVAALRAKVDSLSKQLAAGGAR